jgi:phosphate transport system permease protein
MLRRLRGRDLGFKIGTGAVAAIIVVIVAGIGFELWRQSWLSIQKFGLGFWLGDIWDPVSGEFGAKPFIWGTLYSSILALALATPISLGIAIFLSELCPARLRLRALCWASAAVQRVCVHSVNWP